MNRLVWRTLFRSPRRLAVGVLGIAVPVALLAATSFFVDSATRSMSAQALKNVKIDMEAVANSPVVDTKAISAELTAVPGITSAERFAAVQMEATLPGAASPVPVRVFAVDPPYLQNHSWVRVTSGSLAAGALLSDPLTNQQGASTAKTITVALPGGSAPASLTIGGSTDLRDATPWWAIPSGDQQGDPVFSPDAILVDYVTFERAILPALQADFALKGPRPRRPRT